MLQYYSKFLYIYFVNLLKILIYNIINKFFIKSSFFIDFYFNIINLFYIIQKCIFYKLLYMCEFIKYIII